MASFTLPCPKCSTLPRLGLNLQSSQQQVSFSSSSSLPFGDQPISGFQNVKRKQFCAFKLQTHLNEVAVVQKSSNSAPLLSNSVEVAPVIEKSGSSGEVSCQSAIPDVASISAFMNQVSDLVKLVDSRDIVELQLKQLDCEVIIRKAEALQQPPANSLVTLPPQLPNHFVSSPPTPALAIAPAPAAPKAKTSGPAPSPAKTSTSSHPPLKCPMAGTFYRSPAPSEPPFVKVGDKVQKGQVLCIIEAMKLMNEIEADQSGTVAEILVEDGKAVSVDMPLFVIVP